MVVEVVVRDGDEVSGVGDVKESSGTSVSALYYGGYV